MGRRAIEHAWVFALGTLACSATPPRPPEQPAPLVIPPIGAAAPSASSRDAAHDPIDPRPGLTITARDPRIGQRRPRSRALVMTEAQGLERLLDRTAASATDRPILRRRLAESYSELAHSASGPDAARAREEALKHYAAIVQDHPQYALIDEVRYYIALFEELNGNASAARRAYYDVIAQSPKSKLIPLCYFGFGEIFSAEAQTDPSKDALALQAYSETLKFPPQENPVYAEALLRIGQTYLHSRDERSARSAFARLRREQPESAAAAAIPAGM